MELNEKAYENMSKEELISEVKKLNYNLELTQERLLTTENANEILRKSILAMIDAITDM